MARIRTAEPGSGASSGATLTRTRTGVAPRLRSPIRTGAIRRRALSSLGLATSTTQPSTGTTPRLAGTTGAVASTVISLASANPPVAKAASVAAMIMARFALHRAAATASARTTAAPASTGQSGGSTFRPNSLAAPTPNATGVQSATRSAWAATSTLSAAATRASRAPDPVPVRLGPALSRVLRAPALSAPASPMPAEPSPDRSAVVTRIAPSPTGMMHIGTARVALFNWLYARHAGGRFLLRIEDTDRERSTPDAVQAILEGLRWLELEPDAEPVFQFARADRHRGAVAELLARDRAYRCFMTVEELETERQAARAAGRAIRSPWRERGPTGGGDRPHVIRFRGPLEGETVVDDLVKGEVRFANRELDDLVLLRSDGTPTYNLAVVVDDHDMGVTHVIRGDDHLSNAARQSLIYQALDWPLPRFAHLPMIHGPDGAKLSKRHGAQGVSEFRDMGYLPEAMRNYLARLGWGHGDAEIFSDAEAITWFDVADVGSSPARLDWAKLNHVNQHYIRVAADDRLLGLTLEVHRSRGVHPNEEAATRLRRAIPLVKEGAKTILELADLTTFVVAAPPVPYDPKSAKLLDEETIKRLSRLRRRLAGQVDWSPGPLEHSLRAFATAEGVGLGKFGPALRLLIGRGAPAPDLASALSALGRNESLARLDEALPPAGQDV